MPYRRARALAAASGGMSARVFRRYSPFIRGPRGLKEVSALPLLKEDKEGER
jgi:hypothetical protein